MENNSSFILKNPSNYRGVFCLWVLMITTVLVFSQPQLKFIDTKKNFGFVKKGEVTHIEFNFTNKGNEPLIIKETKVECSCTTVDFPKEPILPGQSSKITVTFDTKSVYDRQDRMVEVISNATKSIQKIRFKGVVLK